MGCHSNALDHSVGAENFKRKVQNVFDSKSW